MKVPLWLLRERQAYPLEQKVELSLTKIKEWHEHWDGMVYTAFSGGKDSTVLRHLVKKMYPGVPDVFNDTGLEYPEIRKFAKSMPEVVFLKPRRTFRDVITHFGYPVANKEVAQKVYEARTTKSDKLRNMRLSGGGGGYMGGKIPAKWMFLVDAPFPVSHHCCNVLKKYPAKSYENHTGRKPMLGTMINDSQFRRQSYIRNGCSAYNLSRPRSTPIAFWTDDDIWKYIEQESVPYCEIYNSGIRNTGCVFCAFGVHVESEPNKFQRLKVTHQKLWEYCIKKLNMGEVLDYVGVPYV